MTARGVRRPLSASLVAQLLDDPDLLPRIQALPAPALRRVILRVGLEDAGELIALASAEQLQQVFDEDLWRSDLPGGDEAFDAARFALFLEVLLDAGDASVADRLAGFSEDFLVFAFSQLVRVIDTVALTASAGADADAAELDRLLDSSLCQELDEYLVVSRVENGWDAVWASLLALDERHAPLLRAVLDRCWRATQEQVDRAGGLHAALDGEEALLEDARAERDDRRAALGYVSPADARAFLGLAQRGGDPFAPDPITRAYFRALARERDAVALRAPDPPRGRTPLQRLLADAGEGRAPERAERPLPAQLPLFRRALAALVEADPDAHARVVDELAYLANVLVAGDASRARSPAEAAEHVVARCDEGLRRALAQTGGERDLEAACEALRRHGAIAWFRAAWGAPTP